LRGPGRSRAARDLAALELNHGGQWLASLLALAELAPPVGTLATRRQEAKRKRVTVLSKLGKHRAVLRATRGLPADAVSTLLLLRSASVRITGSLDEAAALAEEAAKRAKREEHAVRIAHASYQWCQALVWAGRIEEAHKCLDTWLLPHAPIAASRWVAWANFISGCLLVREGEPSLAIAEFEHGEARFRAEVLIDGLVSIQTARLTALRQLGSDADFERERGVAIERLAARHRRETYYARGHAFTREGLDLEQGEYERMHLKQPSAARETYQRVASSAYPIHGSQAHLGLAMVASSDQDCQAEARRALTVAQQIGSRAIADRAKSVIAGTDTSDEMFYC
jgi:hypothetical protein